MPETECYKVLSVSELTSVIHQNSKTIQDFNECLKTNNAFVYYLKSKQVILLPNSLDSFSIGIIFNSIKCFNHFKEKDSFPIENPKKTIEEVYQSDIIDIGNNIGQIIKHVNQITNSNETSSLNNPDHISDLLIKARLKWRNLSKKDLFYSALVLGEYIRILHGGNWILLKRYGTFNPYYTPAILYPNNSVVLFWEYLNSFFKSPNISPNIFANLPYIKSPGLKLDSPFFKNNYFGYKIF